MYSPEVCISIPTVSFLLADLLGSACDLSLLVEEVVNKKRPREVMFLQKVADQNDYCFFTLA